MNSIQNPLPTVEALANQLLAFRFVGEHEQQFGVDVMLQYWNDEWRLVRVDFEAFVDDPRRYFIGPGMQRFEAYAIARGMLRNAQKEANKRES